MPKQSSQKRFQPTLGLISARGSKSVDKNKIKAPSMSHFTMAVMISGLLTVVKTGITIVSYFGNVTASLFALTIVRKFTTLVIPKQDSWVRLTFTASSPVARAIV